MTKEELIADRYSCVCAKIYTSRSMIDPDCTLHEHGPEIADLMDTYAAQQAEGFAEWIQANAEHWKDYWVLTTSEESDNTRYTTAELYQIYKQQNPNE